MKLNFFNCFFVVDIKESELNNELNENFQKKTLKTTHVEMIPQGVLILPKNSTATQKDEIPKHDLDESLVVSTQA